MGKEGQKRVRMEAAEMKDLVIIKKKFMEENKRIQADDQTRMQGPDSDRTMEENSNETIKGNVGHQRGSATIGGASSMDEKSSGMGRRDKGTGLATKDGLTGSDFDGQVKDQ